MTIVQCQAPDEHRLSLAESKVLSPGQALDPIWREYHLAGI